MELGWAVAYFALGVVILGFAWLAIKGRKIRLRETEEAANSPLVEARADFLSAAPKDEPPEHLKEKSPGQEFAVRIVGGIVASALGLGAVGIFGLQLFVWLKTGDWPPLSLIDGLQEFSDSAWLKSPSDWVGVHEILSRVPLSFALLLACWAVVWMVFFSDD